MVIGIITWFIIVNIVIAIVLFVSGIEVKKIMFYLTLSIIVQVATLLFLFK